MGDYIAMQAHSATLRTATDKGVGKSSGEEEALTVFLQELESIIKALTTHVTEDLWWRGEERMRDAVQVARVELDGGACQADVEEAGRVVIRADVTLPSKG